MLRRPQGDLRDPCLRLDSQAHQEWRFTMFFYTSCTVMALVAFVITITATLYLAMSLR